MDQATTNFLETFPFFAALVLIAHVINHHSALTIWGVHLYFWARLAYLIAAAIGLGRAFACMLDSLRWHCVALCRAVLKNFRPYTVAHTVQGAAQIIAQGPVAALEFIKNLGTNGGGFFNANGAHPFENPTPLTNFAELLAIVVIPAAFTHAFGRMVLRPRDGWVIFWTMTALFVVGLLVCTWAEVVRIRR